jgi:low affinity Fe/Cu permease
MQGMSLEDMERELDEAIRRRRELRKETEARKASSEEHIRDTRERLERGVDRDGLEDPD